MNHSENQKPKYDEDVPGSGMPYIGMPLARIGEEEELFDDWYTTELKKGLHKMPKQRIIGESPIDLIEANSLN